MTDFRKQDKEALLNALQNKGATEIKSQHWDTLIQCPYHDPALSSEGAWPHEATADIYDTGGGEWRFLCHFCRASGHIYDVENDTVTDGDGQPVKVFREADSILKGTSGTVKFDFDPDTIEVKSWKIDLSEPEISGLSAFDLSIAESWRVQSWTAETGEFPWTWENETGTYEGVVYSVSDFGDGFTAKFVEMDFLGVGDTPGEAIVALLDIAGEDIGLERDGAWELVLEVPDKQE